MTSLISGINAQIAVKVFGEDRDTLKRLTDEIRTAMSGIRGVEDLAI
jgi:HME family heavy-metal exporter